MARARNPDEPVALKLTAGQRQVIAELAPEFMGRLKLEAATQRVIRFTRDELKAIQEKINAALHRAEPPHWNALLRLGDKLSQARTQPRSTARASTGELVYQFKVTLLETYPPIWRRIQVPDCTLDQLHEYIQTAMGWTNSHLHHFRIGGKLYGDPTLMADNFNEFGYGNSTTTRLSDIIPAKCRRFRFGYEYDFGDSWEHEILFEGRKPAEPGQCYPVCVDGARACPPEDVGGVWGYADFVEAMADPNHERHDELEEWYGQPFDPEAFDAAEATRAMRHGLPDWRSMV